MNKNKFWLSNKLFTVLVTSFFIVITSSSSLAQALLAYNEYIFLGTTHGVLRSTDKGKTWVHVNSGLPTEAALTDFAILRNRSQVRVYASTFYSGGSFVSTNFGESWDAFNEGLPLNKADKDYGIDKDYYPALWALATRGSDIFTGMSHDGIYAYFNTGTQWTEINSGLPTRDKDIRSLGVCNSTVFAGTDRNGIFRWNDNNRSWSAVNTGIERNEFGSYWQIRTFVATGTKIFAGSFGSGVFRSTNNGINWSAVNSGLTDLHIHDLTVSNNCIFAATKLGLFCSTDDGASWTAYGKDIQGKEVKYLAATSIDLYVLTKSAEFFHYNLKHNPVSEKYDMKMQTELFLRDSFFKYKPFKITFNDDFKNWILKSIPSNVPPFYGDVSISKLENEMSDSEILSKLGNPKPFTVNEFAAIIRHLLLKQPYGEDGLLANHMGQFNIFYVRLKKKTVVVDIGWWDIDRDLRNWQIDVYDLDHSGGKWTKDSYVFSRD